MAKGEKIAVLNPVGFPPKVTRRSLAPRLDTLDDKTVFLVDCRFDDSELLLRQVENWFHDRMPGVRTEFRRIAGNYLKDDPNTWAEIKASGDAAIIGVGH